MTENVPAGVLLVLVVLVLVWAYRHATREQRDHDQLSPRAAREAFEAQLRDERDRRTERG